LSSPVLSVPVTLPNPVHPARRVAAVLFDLDGTLYDQRRMRAFMAAELLTLPFKSPFETRRVWKGLSAYRRAQEALRTEGWSGSAAVAQLTHAAQAAAVPAAALAPIVDEWMHERPLRHLAACRAPGLGRLLAFLDDAGVPMGVLSDYPVRQKLRALGVAKHFSVVLSASDPEVNAFKPNPRGFLAAAERWGLDPDDVLYVGDRVEVDAAGAAAAGMPCVIVSRSARPTHPANGTLVLDSLERLHDVLSS
jgi:FMN phosphatase YigB (HAD superfamily)